mmetsp:Transcript_21480/g.52574  ORF Transcript_21480/g.52574 Transcript_21480/m.52574 type:complete len:85 (-) Transcript_21480:453-707(-)
MTMQAHPAIVRTPHLCPPSKPCIQPPVITKINQTPHADQCVYACAYVTKEHAMGPSLPPSPSLSVCAWCIVCSILTGGIYSIDI